MYGTLDVTKYVKIDYNDIKDLIATLSIPYNITRSLLNDLFSNRSEKQPNGKYKILPPKYNSTDYFDLPAGILKNQPTAVKDTTIGIFIYNSLVINNAFHSKVSYINNVMNSDNFDKLQSIIASNLLNGNITVQEFGEYCNTTIWIGYFTELFMPGLSLDFTYPNAKVMELKAKLLKENIKTVEGKLHDSVDVSDYSNKIEKPLVNAAKEIMKDNPSSRLFDLSKPSFKNNYKNSCITNGPLVDPVSGKYKINTNCYCEGSSPEVYDSLCNKAITASASRAVATQFGGTWSKYLSAAMQNVQLDVAGSDCGTTQTLLVTIDKQHLKAFQYNYCIVNGKNVLMTPEFLSNNIGKQIHMRTPMYCKGKKICNKCMGDLMYKLGIKNVGLTSSVPTGKQMNLSMKAMHDITIHPIKINAMNDTLFQK